jgi:hypothetical protein
MFSQFIIFIFSSQNILKNGSFPFLDGTIFNIWLMDTDGRYHMRNINLDDHFANDHGKFVPNDNHFSRSARNISLRWSSQELMLKAELLNRKNGEYVWAEADLSAHIYNSNGGLIFVGS